MKKTNVLLVLILLINAVILWQVMCPSCGGQSKCSAQTECSADGDKCDHSDKKECCKANKECKHGDHTSCKHGESCTHGKKCDHAATCDSTCLANQSMTKMMLHMPAEHTDETIAWMTDSLGLSTEQVESITATVSIALSHMETAHEDLKSEVLASDNMIKEMLNEDQMAKVNAMMRKHCIASKETCSYHGDITEGDHHGHHH